MAEDRKMIAQNRKARHDYFIEDTLEAGLALVGTEVKSLRQGKANLRDSYVIVKKGEAFVRGVHISPYEKGNINNVDPLRERKLLLHVREIARLEALSMQKGFVLVPLSLYFTRGIVKMELAIARGKKLYDKRETVANRDAQREIERKIKDYAAR